MTPGVVRIDGGTLRMSITTDPSVSTITVLRIDRLDYSVFCRGGLDLGGVRGVNRVV